MARPSRGVAVKDGRLLRPPAGLVLDGREHGGRLVCVGDNAGRLMLPLEIERREIADRGMAPARIVEPLDEAEEGASRLGGCCEPTACEQLAFERGEEALAHR